jgi:cytochrome P450
MNMRSGIPVVDLSKVAELGNELLVQLNELREAAPVSWNDSMHAWVVTGYKEVSDGFLGKVPLSCVRIHHAFTHIPKEQQEAHFPRILQAIPTWVLNSDAPRHTRLRLLMMSAFSRKVVETIRPFARKTIDKVLDRAAAKGEVEFIDEVARAITGRVVMHFLGIPDRYWDDLERWSYSINVAFGTARSNLEILIEAEQALIEMQQVFAEQIEERKRVPTGDFLSELVQARDGEDRLSTEELYGVLLVSLIAGHDTTMNTMGLGTVALVQKPEVRSEILAGKHDLTSMLMELMRYVAMSNAFPRIAAQDFEWHGNEIKAGDTVVMMIAGANRDPRVFPNPENVDFDQHSADKVLSFGAGKHHCIGHFLAKMQLGEFFPELFRRFEVQILDEELVWWPVLSQRGLQHLNVRLVPRAEAKRRSDPDDAADEKCPFH